MKAILISIKPKYVAKILNGEKTIEIRKTMPKSDLPIDVYIYCTKDTKVVAKFTLNKVEEIKFDITCITNDLDKLYTNTNDENKLLKNSCLTKEQISSYLKIDGCFPYLSSVDKGYFSNGYAWHISNLIIFDKPKELSEFRHWVSYEKCKKCSYKEYYGINPCLEIESLTKAPQSYMFIEID